MLRTKIVLASAAVTTMALALTAALLILFVRHTTLESIEKTAIADTENFAVFFTRPTENEKYRQELLERTAALYRFQNMSMHESFTLHDGTEYLSNRFGFAPETLNGFVWNDFSGSPCYALAELGGETYALVTRMVDLGQKRYALSLVRDVTATLLQLRRIAWVCVALTAAVAAAATATLWQILRGITKPITSLREGASRIASGEYAHRIRADGRDELALLAADFNTMAESVEDRTRALHELNERQQMFINDLSHEMKTPVTSILLNTETLLTRPVPEEERSNILLRIYDQGRWLERLSQKLMTLVLLQNEVERKPEPLSKLVEAVDDTVRKGVEQAGIRLVCTSDDSAAEMEPDLMRSAVVNLVENAKRASKPGDTITLTAKAGTITVADAGRGIPQAELDRITEPFYRVDRSRSRKFGGAGLGLTIVREIVSAHGGQLFIESTEGKGTRMTIRLK